MTEADRCIADLDAALSAFGETVLIERLADGPDGMQVGNGVKCPAKIGPAQPQDLLAGEADTVVVISPTALSRRQWPAPPRKNDRITYRGANGADIVGTVESVTERRVLGQVVRYDIRSRT